MNKKATTINTVLIFMIVVVLTSAVVLSLIKFGVIETNPTFEQVDVLNTEFVPLERSGKITINEVSLCRNLSATLDCIGQGTVFTPGDVHFIIDLESSVYAGDIVLSYNYRVKDPDGFTILEIDDQDTFYFKETSNNDEETVLYTDFIHIRDNAPKGQYSIEFIIENVLLNKKATIVQRFEVE